MNGDLLPILDYGLGTFTDQEGRLHPLVLQTMQGRRYHLSDHSGRLSGETWAEEFARDGLELTLCETCKRSATHVA